MAEDAKDRIISDLRNALIRLANSEDDCHAGAQGPWLEVAADALELKRDTDGQIILPGMSVDDKGYINWGARRVSISAAQAAILFMFEERTYAISLPNSVDRRVLEGFKLIEWMPPKFGGSSDYGITQTGKEYRRGLPDWWVRHNAS